MDCCLVKMSELLISAWGLASLADICLPTSFFLKSNAFVLNGLNSLIDFLLYALIKSYEMPAVSLLVEISPCF